MKNRLREIRKNQNMTQADFGQATGKSRDVITSYELGKAVPDDTFLMLLERLFGYRFAWIKTGEGDPKPPESFEDKIGKHTADAAKLDPEKIRQRIIAAIEGMEPERVALMWQLIKTGKHIKIDE